MNTGSIIGNKYLKKVKFDSAVRQVTDEISIHEKDWNDIQEKKPPYVTFIDLKLDEAWLATRKDCEEFGDMQYNEYQGDTQYYIPTSVFTKKKIKDAFPKYNEKKPTKEKV